MASSMNQEKVIERIHEILAKYETQLQGINTKIWSNPEIGFEEHQAHDTICAFFDSLAAEGYQVHRKAFGLDTSFDITFSHRSDRNDDGSGRTVAFNAEYDALPGVGHACGHNLIATSSIAAFLATCETMSTLHSYSHSNPANSPNYTVRLLGTPAEEGGGGKNRLLAAGAYTSVDACLMVHPVPILTHAPALLSVASTLRGGFLAKNSLTVTFTGKPAHAAAAPWEGINALDAVVAAYVNISLLRQQILPSQRIHGVIVNGGDRPNVIPMEARVEYSIRSEDVKTLKPLTERVMKCFTAAGEATGCEVDFEWGESYMDVRANKPICETYVSAMQAMGHETVLDNANQDSLLVGASTDMGNVSYAVPGFHGLFTIPAKGVNHHPDFTAGAGSSEAFKRSLYCAAGMALVACKVLVDEDGLAGRVREDFDKQQAEHRTRTQ